MITLVRYSRIAMKSYEVSTRGDKRFSALVAKLPDGRTIEVAYQCGVKGYDTWREGKGKLPLTPMTRVELQNAYLGLWREWAEANPELIDELRDNLALDFVESGDMPVLTDMFASKKGVSQAWALAKILEEGGL